MPDRWDLQSPQVNLPTFSSLLATLKANSVTLPAAQRAALEECSSFQMVSLSTCKQGNSQTGMGTGHLSWGSHALCQSPCSEDEVWATLHTWGKLLSSTVAAWGLQSG